MKEPPSSSILARMGGSAFNDQKQQGRSGCRPGCVTQSRNVEQTIIVDIGSKVLGAELVQRNKCLILSASARHIHSEAEWLIKDESEMCLTRMVEIGHQDSNGNVMWSSFILAQWVARYQR